MMFTDESLRLLILTDIHHATSDAEDPASPWDFHCRLGRELIRRAMDDADRQGGFDAIVLLGDLLNDGTAPGSGESLRQVVEEVRRGAGDRPVIVVPGNHDGDPDRIVAAFDQAPGPVALRGRDGTTYRVVPFIDRYGEEDRCTRGEEALRELLAMPADPGSPILVLQHNPLSPEIESDYPFMFTNRAEVMDAYERAGVTVSFSGHFHKGQDLNEVGGVGYFTARALCEAPFNYTLASLRGKQVRIEARTLAVPDPPLIDGHCHTEFAYCAQDANVTDGIDRARTFGLAGVCLTEHAPQLYCSSEQFWAAEHIRRPAVWRDAESSRMAQFLSTVRPLRDSFVRVGLEAELDADGALTLHEQHRKDVDVVLGAVHFLPENHEAMSEADSIEAFLRVTRGILGAGVDILAHPLRFLNRRVPCVPDEVRTELADMLAQTSTAAEVNYHIHRPDDAFFLACLERGVKIAFGTDAHEVAEAGGLAAHLAFLRRIAGRDDVADMLWYPAPVR
jgi:histidinol phosphatase-like PHP family hydrolase/predicted MPP superfamily phosphohydrolase